MKVQQVTHFWMEIEQLGVLFKAIQLPALVIVVYFRPGANSLVKKEIPMARLKRGYNQIGEIDEGLWQRFYIP